MATEKPLSLLAWKLLCWMAEKPDQRGFQWVDFKPLFWNARGMAAPALACVKVLEKRGYFTEPTEHGTIRLNELGKNAARTLAEPAWTPPKAPKLDDRDYEVLRSLSYSGPLNAPQWRAPMEVGGGSRSHHSYSLTKLVLNGLAEGRDCSQRFENGRTGADFAPRPTLFPRRKGSREFRINDAGMKALEAYRQL